MNFHHAHRLIRRVVIADNSTGPWTHSCRVEAIIHRRRAFKEHDGIHQLRAKRGMVGTAEDGKAGRKGGIGVHVCEGCMYRYLMHIESTEFQFFPRSIFVD